MELNKNHNENAIGSQRPAQKKKKKNILIKMYNAQQTSKKRMDGNFSDVQHILKNGKKWDSFVAHYKQQFKYIMSHTDLCKCMTFKVVKQINPIGAM